MIEESVMVMDSEKNMEFSIDQARKKFSVVSSANNVSVVAPCRLPEAGTKQCLYRLTGTITCPVKLKKGNPPNDFCQKFISDIFEQ